MDLLFHDSDTKKRWIPAYAGMTLMGTAASLGFASALRGIMIFRKGGK